MKTKIAVRWVMLVSLLFLLGPEARAQELAKYRSFVLESGLTSVLKGTELKSSDVRVLHTTPARIEELTWWPPTPRGSSTDSDSVEQVLFSFCDGQLYKISVAYDRNAIKGLTAADMIQSISAKYRTAPKLAPESEFGTDNQFDSKQQVLATWEDSLDSATLVRSSYSEGFGLVIVSKRLSTAAEAEIAVAAKLEEQQRPEKEADLRKKEQADLEAMRQKNRKLFHP